MNKIIKEIFMLLLPLIGIYYNNEYLILYIILVYIFLFNIKWYYIFFMIFLYFIFDLNKFIPILIIIFILSLSKFIKSPIYRLLSSFLVFEVYIFYNYLYNINYLVIYTIILIFYVLLICYFIVHDLNKDFYLNKFTISLILSMYLLYSNKAYLAYFILLMCNLNKRDIFHIPFIFISGIIYDIKYLPYYLFFIALCIKNIYTISILSILSIYIFKDNYAYYIPIIINIIMFILYIINNKDKFNIESNKEESVKEYINQIKDNSYNLEDYDLIDYKICQLLKSYCLNCSNKNICLSKKRINLYHYLMSEICNNVRISKDIDYFIYNCEYKKMMDEIEKINFNLESNLNISQDYLDIINEDNDIKKRVYNCFKNYNIQDLKINNNYSYSITFNDYMPNYLIKYLLKKKNINIKKDNNFYKIEEIPNIKIKSGSIILSKGGGHISGDNCLIKKGNTFFYGALSDGMGSGLKAYMSSSSLLKRLDKMLSLSYNSNLIVKMLKHLTQISLYTTSYATLDFISIDLITSKAYLYKVASASSLFIRDNKIIEYETKTLPLEYDNIIDLYEIDIKRNDLILLMSDGVYDFIDKKNLYAYILSISYLDTDRLVYNIGKYVYDTYNKKLRDDTSILAVKVV